MHFAYRCAQGPGRLTACIRACGLKDSFAVDTRVEGAVCPLISLDLSHAEGQKHFMSLLDEANLVYVHVSPPCGTAHRGPATELSGRFASAWPSLLKRSRQGSSKPGQPLVRILCEGLQGYVHSGDFVFSRGATSFFSLGHQMVARVLY